jgi:squalene-hopene/tetraprenyl-beta-curcumene cyclase/sporulenol synthase
MGAELNPTWHQWTAESVVEAGGIPLNARIGTLSGGHRTRGSRSDQHTRTATAPHRTFEDGSRHGPDTHGRTPMASDPLPFAHSAAARAELLLGRARLVRRVTERVAPTGLVSAPCESRVLESALLLHLLTAEDVAPDAADRLRRCLKGALDTGTPDAVQAALGRAALGDTLTGSESATWALSAFEHFTAPRKRLMFQTLLAELGACEHPVPAARSVRVDGQQSWLRLEMRAIEILLAHGNGSGHTIAADDWTQLAPAVRPGPVWEGNHLARLLGLLALRKHPEHRPAVRRALHAVVAELRPDGGLPYITGLDVFATAIAGLALAKSGAPATLLASMADTLAAQQNPDGGFGYTVGVRQSDVDDTSYAIEFLRTAAARAHGTAIERAEAYLLAQRNPDGGFPTFVAGTPSEVTIGGQSRPPRGRGAGRRVHREPGRSRRRAGTQLEP